MHKITTQAVIKSVELLSNNVYQVLLQPEESVEFQAGQYLEIGVTDTIWAPFSIACAPGSQQLELHIQYLPGRETSELLQKQLKDGGELTLCLASGECVLPEQEQPLLLVAAGTGFAQMKSLLEEAFKRNWQAPLTLYWGARNVEGLYALPQALAWEKQHSNFQLFTCVDLADADWKGRNASLTESLAMDFIEGDSAAQVKGFISGSPAVVYAVEDLMMSRGMPAKALLSDAHAYAPRNYD
ncbi:NAD(P)H-flavin reductase [Marinospirillum sp.]|uniref:NAD(P)H-flavin reductase n=1 Tax=Marinospirillum sp. TaxID=2183934 RepID=UPI00384D5098